MKVLFFGNAGEECRGVVHGVEETELVGVSVAVSSACRGDDFKARRFGIDGVKESPHGRRRRW